MTDPGDFDAHARDAHPGQGAGDPGSFPIAIENPDHMTPLAVRTEMWRFVKLKHPNLFLMNGRIVQLQDNGDRLKTISTPDQLAPMVDEAVYFAFPSLKGKPKTGMPDRARISRMFNAPDLPELRNISPLPLILEGGEIVWRRGYHAKSKVFVLWDTPLPDIELDDAWIIADRLLSSPFASIEDRNRALGLWLLPLVRPLIWGPVPFFLVTAASRAGGGGKSHLCESVGVMITGKDPTELKKITPTDWSSEGVRLLMGALLANPDYLILENLETGKRIGNPQFDQLITSGSADHREVQKSYLTHVKHRGVMVGNGIALDMSPETGRRTQQILLEGPPPSGSLTSWILANRVLVVAALAKLIQAGVEAHHVEHQELTVEPLNGFPEWSDMIGGILQGLECSYPLNRGAMTLAARDVYELCTAWWERGPVGRSKTMTELLALIKPGMYPAIEAELEKVGKDGRPNKLQTILSTFLDEPLPGGYRIKVGPRTKDRRPYLIERIELEDET